MRKSARYWISLIIAFALPALIAHADSDPPNGCRPNDRACEDLKHSPPPGQSKSASNGKKMKKEKGYGNELSGKHNRGKGHIHQAAPSPKKAKPRDGALPPGQAKKAQ